MRRGHIFEWIGALGTLASVLALLISLDVFSLPLGSWLQSSVLLPIWLATGLFAVMSLLLFTAGRLLISRGRPLVIPSGVHDVWQYLIDNRTLDEVTRIDFWHYTAETFATPWRNVLEKRRKPLSIRLLVRRPETDPRKHQVSEGTLIIIREIQEANPDINMDVRFYPKDPLLRVQFYFEPKSTTCLMGVYRHAADHSMKFVGAEDNSMVVLNTRRRPERDLIKAFHSRFEYEWANSSPLRAVIFDMDGVLVNSMGYHLHSWREAFRSEQIQFDEESFRRNVYLLEGLDPEQTVKELFQNLVAPVPNIDLVQRLVAKKVDLYLEICTRAMPFEGVHELLRSLNLRGIPTAVVTGSNRDAAERTVQRLFPAMFNVIVTGSDVERGKPDPMPYITALEKLGIRNKDHCLVIENSPLGVRAATGCDLPVYGILINSPIEPRQLEEVGAMQVFASYENLLTTISGLRYDSFQTQQDERPR